MTSVDNDPDTYDTSTFNPMDPAIAGRFFDVLGHLQTSCPVVRSNALGGFVGLTKYDDVQKAAGDWRTFSSAQGAAPAPIPDQPVPLIPLDLDPPFHRSIRNLLNPHFTLAAAQELEPTVRALARSLIDGFRDAESCEFRTSFAGPLPAKVVYEGVLGAPAEDFPLVMRLIKTFTSIPDQAGPAIQELSDWADRLITTRTGDGTERRTDVIDAVLHGLVDGRTLTRDERIGTLTVLITAALDTTTAGLCNMLYHLATDPELQATLRAHPELIDKAVDELLRLEAPAPSLSRTTTCPVEVRGVPIEKGERISLVWAAANRDPDRFPDPDRFQIDRPRNAHMSFGHGVHLCLGRHVARVELRVAIQEMLATFPHIGLAEGAEITFHSGFARYPESVPLVFVR